MPTDMKGLADEIERELMAWRGANGGVFTLRAAAVAVAQKVEAYESAKPKEAEEQPVQKMHTFAASPPAVPGVPAKEDLSLILCEELWTEHGEIRGTAECVERILSLIRPAFEAKEREKAAALGLVEGHSRVISTLEAKLAQAVEALEPFVFGDPAIESILYGGMPDDAPGTITIKLRDIRRARTAASDIRGEKT